MQPERSENQMNFVERLRQVLENDEESEIAPEAAACDGAGDQPGTGNGDPDGKD